MTIVCRSYVIGHKFINPTNECGVQYLPDINPICGLYVCLMLLNKKFINIIYGYWVKIARCGQIGGPCPDVSKMV